MLFAEAAWHMAVCSLCIARLTAFQQSDEAQYMKRAYVMLVHWRNYLCCAPGKPITGTACALLHATTGR